MFLWLAMLMEITDYPVEIETLNTYIFCVDYFDLKEDKMVVKMD